VFFWINSLAVLVQGITYFILIPKINKALSELSLNGFARMMIRLALLSLLIKALLQILLVFPEVAVISYTIRLYVIGFLLMVLLGAMSLGMAGLAMAEQRLALSVLSKTGWGLIIVGFFGSELLLFGQGTLVWLQWGYLSWYHLGLFVVSIFF